MRCRTQEYSRWLENQHEHNLSVSLMLNQEQAQCLSEDLQAKHGESTANEILLAVACFTQNLGSFLRFCKKSLMRITCCSWCFMLMILDYIGRKC